VRTFRLTLEYDGSDFDGWQIQDGESRTVQGALREALARVTGETGNVLGAGRTDAGVHAEGQVAAVRLATSLEPDALRRALNGVLPRDVAVREVREAPCDFHPIRDARSKLYRYAVWNGPGRSPLRDRTHLYVAPRLDVEAMRAAAKALVGRHDFAAFMAAGSDVRSTERTMLAFEIEARGDGEILFSVEGSGFLRHMVRIVVGTLLEVGRGRRPAADVAAVLAARERRAAGPTAPAHGLTLVAVRYIEAPGGRASDACPPLQP
jgi:tRNA pseudouridine38-40 synthase